MVRCLIRVNEKSKGPGKGLFFPVGWMACLVALAAPATGADFLNVQEGARSVAMGGAYVSLAEGSEALYWNPAGLAQVLGTKAFFQTAAISNGGMVQDAGIARARGRSGWGVSFRSANSGSVAVTDENGNGAGNTEARGFSASGGVARRWEYRPHITIGAAGHYVRSTVVSTARGLEGSMGLMATMGSRYRVGAFRRWGCPLDYGAGKEPTPSLTRLGVSVQWNPGWRVSFDAHYPQGGIMEEGVGLEMESRVGRNVRFLERIGYNTRWRSQRTGAAGVSGGVGIVWKNAILDYALRFEGESESHFLSVSHRWGGPRSVNSDVESLIQEGQALLAQRRIYEAIIKFNEALRLDPTNVIAREALRSAGKELEKGRP